MPKETNAQLIDRIRKANLPFYVAVGSMRFKVPKTQILGALQAYQPNRQTRFEIVPDGYAYLLRAAK